MKWMTRLQELGGAATTQQLRAAGASRETLAEAVRRREVQRPRKGVYALPTLSGPPRAAVQAGVRLSCVTACRSYGLWAGLDARMHALVSPHRQKAPEGFVCHWRASEPHDEIWRVSVADCLRSVGRCADGETAVAAFDTALTAGLVTSARLRSIVSSCPRFVRSRAADARAGSESGIESIVRQRLEARGHHIQQQVHVAGVGRVDMLVDGELFLELDGYAFHGDREAFERDRRRDSGLAREGRLRLRATARQVLREWPSVESSIDRILQRHEPSVNSQRRRDQPGRPRCSPY